MSAIKNIKRGIIRNISAISSINKVYGYERLNVDGFPAVCVTFSGTDNQFHTNAENERVYTYRLLVLAQIGQDINNANAVDEAEEIVQDVVGDIMDVMDSDITLDENSQVVYIEAAIGQPGYVEYEGGMARSAEVMIKVHSIFLV